MSRRDRTDVCLLDLTPRPECSTDRRRRATDQLAPAFRHASFDCHGLAVDGQAVVSGDDLVDTVRLAAGVGHGAEHLVAQSGDGFAHDVVVRRTADHGAAVVGFVADCNDVESRAQN